MGSIDREWFAGNGLGRDASGRPKNKEKAVVVNNPLCKSDGSITVLKRPCAQEGTQKNSVEKDKDAKDKDAKGKGGKEGTAAKNKDANKDKKESKVEKTKDAKEGNEEEKKRKEWNDKIEMLKSKLMQPIDTHGIRRKEFQVSLT